MKEAVRPSPAPDAWTEYWNQFYAGEHPEIEQPSSFARSCLGRLPQRGTILEIGCGNGRDALFFAANGLRVLACDPSSVAIDRLSDRAARDNGLPVMPRFFTSSISTLPARLDEPVDAVYLRFVLHAVPRDEASRAIRWARDHLAADGVVLAEARSVLGDLYGVGTPLGDDAFEQDGHYRRFIRSEELVAELRDSGFVIDDLVESDGLAALGADDPVVIRVVARRADRV